MAKKHLLISLAALASATAADAKIEGVDVTSKIANADCEDLTGWTAEQGVLKSKPGGLSANSIEYWEPDAAKRGFNFSQKITLEPGKYTLSAKIVNSLNGQAGKEGSEDIGLYALIGTETYKDMVPVYKQTNDDDALQHGRDSQYSVEFEIKAKTTVTIGVKNFQAMSARWMVMDDFHLTLTYTFDAEQRSFELQKVINTISGYENTKSDYLDEAAQLQSDITGLGNYDYDTYLKYKENYSNLDEAISAKIQKLAADAKTAEAKALLPKLWEVYGAFTSAKAAAQTAINAYKYDKDKYQAQLNAVVYEESNVSKYGKDGVVADENIVNDYADIVKAIEAESAKIKAITDEGNKVQTENGTEDQKAVAAVNTAVQTLKTALGKVASKIENNKQLDEACGTYSTSEIETEIASVFKIENEIGASAIWTSAKVTEEQNKIAAKISKLDADVDAAIANHKAYVALNEKYNKAIEVYNAAVADVTNSINSDDFDEDKTVPQTEIRDQRSALSAALRTLDKAHTGKTVVKEEEAISKSISDAVAAIEAVQTKWVELVASYNTAYTTKKASIDELSKKYNDGANENYDKVKDFQRVIDAKAKVTPAIEEIQVKLDAVRGKVAVTTLDLTAGINAANALITAYNNAIADAVTALNANTEAKKALTATGETIAKQKTATAALQSKDKKFTVGTKCDVEFAELATKVTEATDSLARVYDNEKVAKAEIGSTIKEKKNVDSFAKSVSSSLSTLNGNAKAAVARYDALLGELSGWSVRLDSLTKHVEGLNIYKESSKDAEGNEMYNYEKKIANLRDSITVEARKLSEAIAAERINDWSVNDTTHYTGVLTNLYAVVLNKNIASDIASLENNYESLEAGFKAHIAYVSCKAMHEDALKLIGEKKATVEALKPNQAEVGIAYEETSKLYEEIYSIVMKLSAEGLNPTDENKTSSLQENTEKIAKLSEVKNTINSVNKQISELETMITTAKDAVTANNAMKTELDKSVAALQEGLKGLVSEISDVNGWYNASMNPKVTITKDINALSSDIATSNTAQTLVKDNNDEKNEKGEVTKPGFATRIDAISKNITAVKADIAKTEEFYVAIYGEKNSVKANYEALLADENYKAVATYLTTDLTAVEDAKSTAEKNHRNYAKQGVVVSRASTINSQISAANTAISNLQAKAKSVKENLDAHTAITDSLNSLALTVADVKGKLGASYDNSEKCKEIVDAAEKYAKEKHEFKVDDNCMVALNGVMDQIKKYNDALATVAEAAEENAKNKADLIALYNELDKYWYEQYADIQEAYEKEEDVLADAKKEFEGLQNTLFDISAQIDKDYKDGKLTDKFGETSTVGDIESKISDLQNKITNLRGQYDGTYSEAVAETNAKLKADVEKEIQAAKDSYTAAIDILNALKAVDNKAWANQINAEVQEANDSIYPIALAIRANESAMYTAFRALKTNEYFDTTEYSESANASKAKVDEAMNKLNGELNPLAEALYSADKTNADNKLNDAKVKVAGYKNATKAFDDVVALIKDQDDKFEKAPNKCVVYNDVANELARVDGMIANDLKAAAKKEYNTWLKTYTDAYAVAQDSIMKLGTFKDSALVKLQGVYDKYIVTANDSVKNTEDLVESLAGIQAPVNADFLAKINEILTETTLAYNEKVASEKNQEAIAKIEGYIKEVQDAIDALDYSTETVLEEDFVNIQTMVAGVQNELDAVTYNEDDAEKDVESIKTACDEILKKLPAIEETIDDAKKNFIANDLEAQKTLYLATEYKLLVDKYNQIAADFTVAAKTVEDYKEEVEGIKWAIENAESVEELKNWKDTIVDLNARMDGTIHATEIADMLAKLNNTISGLKTSANEISTDKIAENIYTDGVTYAQALVNLNNGIDLLKGKVENAGNKLYYYNDEYTKNADALTAEASNLKTAADAAIANVVAWENISQIITDFLDEIAETEEHVKNECPNVDTLYTDRFDALKSAVEKYSETERTLYIQGTLNAESVEAVTEHIAGLPTETLNGIKEDADAAQLVINNNNARKELLNSITDLFSYRNEVSRTIETYADEVTREYNDTLETIYTSIMGLRSEIRSSETPYADKADYEQKMTDIRQSLVDIADAAFAANEDYLANHYEKGDINHDGKVNAADYEAIVEISLGQTPILEIDGEEVEVSEGSNPWKAALIDEDEVVDIADVVGLVNLWKGLNANGTPKMNKIKSLRMDTSNDVMSIENLGNGMFAINLDNVNSYVGFQMDIQLPEGLKIVETSLSGRAADHNVATSLMSDGTLRVIASSTNNTVLSDNSGALVTFSVESDGTFGGGDIIVNGKFADSNAYGQNLTAVAAAASEVTGIATNNIVVRSMYKIYNAAGVLVDKLQKGVNVLVGEDGSTKKVMVK